MPELKILNPWDVESHRVHDTSGLMSTLYKKNGGGGFLILEKRKKDNEKCGLSPETRK